MNEGFEKYLKEKGRDKLKRPSGGDGSGLIGAGGCLMVLSIIASLPFWGILAVAVFCQLIK